MATSMFSDDSDTDVRIAELLDNRALKISKTYVWMIHRRWLNTLVSLALIDKVCLIPHFVRD